VPPDDPRPPLDPDEIRARIDRLVEKLLAELRAIDREAGEKRAAAMARSGLPAEFLESVLGQPEESQLTSADHYDQNDEMSQAQTEGSPRKLGRPPNVKEAGPFMRAAIKLGMSATELAAELDVKPGSARNWDKDGRRIPDDAQAKIDAMLAAKADANAKDRARRK